MTDGALTLLSTPLTQPLKTSPALMSTWTLAPSPATSARVYAIWRSFSIRRRLASVISCTSYSDFDWLILKLFSGVNCLFYFLWFFVVYCSIRCGFKPFPAACVLLSHRAKFYVQSYENPLQQFSAAHNTLPAKLK